MKTKHKIRSRNWIVTLLLASASLGYVFLIFVPQQKTIAESRRQIRDMQQYIIDSDRLTSVIHDTQQRLDKTNGFVRDWRGRAPRINQLGSLFGQVTEQAKTAGATILRFAPSSAVELESLHQVPLQLLVEGTYHQLFEFIRGLEELPPTIWVDHVNMEGNAESGQKLRCEVKLTVFADKTALSD